MDKAQLLDPKTIHVEKALDGIWILSPVDEPDLVIPLRVEGPKTLSSEIQLDPEIAYQLEGPAGFTATIEPSAMALLLSSVVSAALTKNFVFTKYLGLCVFFGVSKKRSTAIGMGVTFVIVSLISAALSWLWYQGVLKPLELGFLEIISFIGIVAFLVQGTDIVLKKVQPVLHRKFGIYLVLITTNCIILAIPLLNASNNATFVEAMGLALGASLGFALALFLMSCCREKLDLAPIPQAFKGLPIAFVLTGLFALTFLGFAGF